MRSTSASMGGLNDEQRLECQAMYQQGAEMGDIAERYGVHYGSIQRYLRELGTKLRKRIGNPYDSVDNALSNKGNFDLKRDCSVYIFDIPNHENTHSKIGIAFDVDQRTSGGGSQLIYGELWFEKIFSSRIDAFFIEQAVLQETESHASWPHDVTGYGLSEIRELHAEVLVEMTESFINIFETMNRWEFAAKYVPMKSNQREKCLLKASE